MIKNKKALSAVISTLLILLLSLIATSVVWSVASNIIKPETLLSPESCLGFQANPPYSLKEACYNETSREIIINLNKKYEDENKRDIFFTLKGNEEASKWCCGENCPNCQLPEKASKKYYLFPINQKPESVTLYIEDCTLGTIFINEC